MQTWFVCITVSHFLSNIWNTCCTVRLTVMYYHKRINSVNIVEWLWLKVDLMANSTDNSGLQKNLKNLQNDYSLKTKAW